MTMQTLTLTLDGITAGDYLAWVSDPEPLAGGITLRSLRVTADPLGDTVRAELWWNGAAPSARLAAEAAGLPATADVIGIEHCETPLEAIHPAAVPLAA